MKMNGKRGIFFLLVLLLVPLVHAADPNRIIVNSEDWKDVYSVMQYGVLSDVPAQFLVSSRHATLILNSIPTTEHLWVVSSKNVPYITG